MTPGNGAVTQPINKKVDCSQSNLVPRTFSWLGKRSWERGCSQSPIFPWDHIVDVDHSVRHGPPSRSLDASETEERQEPIKMPLDRCGGALHHLYPRAFCTLPSFARIKGTKIHIYDRTEKYGTVNSLTKRKSKYIRNSIKRSPVGGGSQRPKPRKNSQLYTVIKASIQRPPLLRWLKTV